MTREDLKDGIIEIKHGEDTNRWLVVKKQLDASQVSYITFVEIMLNTSVGLNKYLRRVSLAIGYMALIESFSYEWKTVLYHIVAVVSKRYNNNHLPSYSSIVAIPFLTRKKTTLYHDH